MVMDYIDFIDSKDIRDFNRETLFSPAELAILVITSKHTSVDMKIKALMIKQGFTVILGSMWTTLKKLFLKKDGLGLKSHCILRV